MNRIYDWIRSHQVTAFFVITFAITWGLGFSYSAVINREMFILSPLVFVATCGPGLAGIIVSTIINTEPKQKSTKSFWSAFFIAWPAAALVGILFSIFINQVPLSPVIVFLYIICVLPVAFIIASSKSPIPTVRNHISSLIRFRSVWRWGLAALLMFPASVLLAVQLNILLSGQQISIFPLPAAGFSLIGLIVVKFLYQIFFFNATGEEVGWRGFALPRLQAQTSPLFAAVIIGFFWAPWHYFLWQAEGRMVSTLSFWSAYILGHMLFSILLTWFFNRSKGSILVVGNGHASLNSATAFMPILNPNILNLTWAIIALLLILLDRMWERKTFDQPF